VSTSVVTVTADDIDAYEEIEYLALLEAEDKESLALDWELGNLRYKLHSAQRKIYDVVAELDATVRDVILLCARRFGKSYLNCIWAIERCIRKPGCFVRIVGPELQQTIDIVDFHMGKIIADAPPGLIKKRGGGMTWTVGASTIKVGAFDKKNVKKNLGQEADLILSEEACVAKSEEFAYGMREILSPQLFHTKGRFIHATTLPPELDHVFITEFMPRAHTAGTLFVFTIDDNPMADEAMRKQAEEDSGGKDTIAYKRNYLCIAEKDSRIVVLPSFSVARHVREFERAKYGNWLLMGDWGGVEDKTWLGVGYWDFELAQLFIVDERMFEPNTSTDLIAASFPVLREWGCKEDDMNWVDAAGQVRVDMESDHDIEIVPPAKDDFDAAINQLELAFRRNKIVIHSRCKHLIAACEYGRFNPRRTDFARTEALGHCDAIAGLMYGWRMADKVTNPFPKERFNREEMWVREDEDDVEIKKLAASVRTF
jgi:hypothetical protein